MEIKSIENLVAPILKSGEKFVSYECKHLLSNGENYGSTMLDLKVKLKTNSGEEEIVSCVAKTCPPTGILWTIFNIPETVKKEIAFYQTVVPTLNNFGKENGIETVLPFFAKCYGARISLDPESDKVDTDAVILLENVKTRGFCLCNRFVGFNKEETMLSLRDLATFHAVPLAHKLQKPEEFKEKILPYLKHDLLFCPPPDMVSNITSFLRNIVSTSPQLACALRKAEENFKKYCDEIVVNPLKIREPFATLIHNDYWINNTLLRYENDSPVENIMVDFQGISYNSPSHDLLFFLYSSVELSFIESNFDYLVKYYFDTFIATLRKFGCQTEQFTFSKFLEEMATVANESQLFHIIMMLQPIYMKKEEAKDLAKMAETMNSITEKSFHENFSKKVIFVLSDFENRGWI